MRGRRGSGENWPSTTRRSVAGLRDSWLLPAVLSTTAGAVDVVGFLALGGLFTAHITGNVVVVAAHYITGGSCQVGPLGALPAVAARPGGGTGAARDIRAAGC